MASVMPLSPLMYCRRPVARPLPRSRPAIIEATPENRPVENLHPRSTKARTEHKKEQQYVKTMVIKPQYVICILRVESGTFKLDIE